MAGRQHEADRLRRVYDDLQARASGVRGQQVRAREALARLLAFADGIADARARGHRYDDAEAVTANLVIGYDLAEVFRRHVPEGPYEATDLALALKAISYLELLLRRVSRSDAALDEAIAVMSPLALLGQPFDAVLDDLHQQRSAGRGR